MSTERLKKYTILHSNDMHGDFLAEAQGAEGRLIGGLALLSGYLSEVRREEKNVLYVISGDMVQGSMIDSEYKGVSTMEIMNYLAPDVVTLGNHELDYGLSHLLFLEKMANFPIVNANLYIKGYHKRLMQPYLTLNVDGFDIMFIGIITQAILNRLRADQVGAFVGLEDATAEVGKICNAYKDSDIDLTILLTHIGFEEDKKLAAMLDPMWGVDLIIGGHSHTILEQPAETNGILIAQAGVGTDQIGRFDIVVDDDTNSIVEWQWQLKPVDETLAEPDEDLQRFIDSFQEVVDRKYNRIICRLTQKLTHDPDQALETTLGNLIADIYAQRARADIALIPNNAIRGQELGPLVTLGALKKGFPYDDAMIQCTISGAQLRGIFAYIMAPGNRTASEHRFQVSRGVQAIYDDALPGFESLTLNGQAVQAERAYTICLKEYTYKNAAKHLGLADKALTARGGPQVVSTSGQDVLEEFLSYHQHLNSQIEGRLVYK